MKNYAGDDKKAQSALFMKEFLKVERIVSKEQSSKQEEEFIDSMITKLEESESCDKNPATLGVELSIENQVAGFQSKNSYKEVKIIEERRGLFFFSSFYRILKFAFKMFYS